MAAVLVAAAPSCGVMYDWVVTSATSARGQVVTVRGTGLRVLTEGTGPRHVVFIHGNPGEMEDFVPGETRLKGDLYTKLLFDRPGHGHSERGNLGEPAELVDGLHELLEQDGFVGGPDRRKVVLVAHSWGGGLAQLYAYAHPDDVAGMVLLAPVAFPDDSLLDPWITTSTLGSLVYGQTIGPFFDRLAAGFVLDEVFAPQFSDQPDYQAHRAAWMYSRTNELRWTGQDDQRLHDALAALGPQRAPLNMPTIILAGAADALVDPTRHAEHASHHFQNVTLALLPGQGHMLPVTQPDLVNKAIEDLYVWLGGGSPPAANSYTPQTADDP